MSTASIAFVEWLQRELAKRNWTQLDLSRHSGISAAGISKIMSSDRGVGIEAVVRIATALNVTTDNVLRQAGLLPTPADATLDDRRLLEDLQRRIERLDAEDRRYLSDLVNRLFPGA